MSRAIAINVAANSSLPGFRGPVYPDGGFVYVPIPEREPTEEPVPTYADLELGLSIPPELRDRRVHLDPCFRAVGCREYTYGDEHGVKAGPISSLSAGDYLLFYATLEPTVPGGDPPSLGGEAPTEDDHPWWAAPEWGAYLIGGFELGMDAVTGERFPDLPPADRELLAGNAHCKRVEFDARVLVYGDPGGSGLFDRAIPLSSLTAGSDPNRIVTELSGDSGAGPWWRRPLRFGAGATDRLLRIVEDGDVEACVSGAGRRE